MTSTGIGFVIAKYRHHRFLTICSTACMTFGAVCMTNLIQETPLFLQEVYNTILALGTGPLWTLDILILQASVSKDELATATTGFGLVRSLSMAIGGALTDISYRKISLTNGKAYSHDGICAIFLAARCETARCTWILPRIANVTCHSTCTDTAESVAKCRD